MWLSLMVFFIILIWVLIGATDAPVTSAAAKPAEPPAPAAAVQRSTRPVPKAPTSQSSAMSSDLAAAPKTPVKGMCYLGASDIVVEFCYNVGDYQCWFLLMVIISSSPM